MVLGHGLVINLFSLTNTLLAEVAEVERRPEPATRCKKRR